MWSRGSREKSRTDELGFRIAAGVGAAFVAWLAGRAAVAVASRVRDRLAASPQPGELFTERTNQWVLSGPMATSDATQSGDGAQKGNGEGGSAEGGNGGQSPSDVAQLKEVGFGEVKHSLPDKETCLTVLEKMLLIRRFEERAGEMYAKAKIGGFLHLCIGEEATVVGATQALRDNDYLMSTYREHGQAIARGTHPNAVMAELFGRVD
ncbi:MAG: pyruvate dehydrogenase component alpha subunit, partial [Thermoleophilaceae bacterium]|nr:pyruvate dehydrogenase component alpha subunit [Thermoleophilaceae bacterium]